MLLQQVAWVRWFGKRNAAGAASRSDGSVCAREVRSDRENGNVYRITDLKPFNVALVPRLLQDGSGYQQVDWQVLKGRPIVLL